MTDNASEEWRETTLGEFAPFVYGKGLPKAKRNPNGDVPIYGSNGVIGFHDEALTDGPTIIIGRKGTIGAVHYSPAPCWPIDTTFFVEGDDAELARFRYYAMSVLNLKDMNSDTAVPGLNRGSAHAVEMLVPSESAQRRVSAALGALDDKIELNARMNETLDETARALFRAWFVDFAPVRAKMSGAWRRGESPPGLPAALYDAFPDAMADSALGEIPAGWEVKGLDEIAQFRNGLALQKLRPKEGEGRLPVVKIAQLRSGRADSGEWATSDITPECVIDDGDVIFAWSASLMVKVWTGGRAALNQHLFKVTSSEYPAWFYLEWVKSHLPEFRRIAEDKTTTMGHIKRGHLAEAKCVVPDRALLSAADDIFADTLAKRIADDVQSFTLAEVRDTLLPKLLSGEISA